VCWDGGVADDRLAVGGGVVVPVQVIPIVILGHIHKLLLRLLV